MCIGVRKRLKKFCLQIEKDLQILKKARLRAHYVCAPDIIQFDECSLRDGSFIGLYTCRRAMKQMNQCLIDVAADRQVIDDCKEEYLRERNFYRAHGTPLKDINREERQVKFWIDKGKKDYSEAKQKFEQTGEAFDWRKLCHDSKFLPK